MFKMSAREIFVLGIGMLFICMMAKVCSIVDNSDNSDNSKLSTQNSKLSAAVAEAIPDVYQVQTFLYSKGYYKGRIDGVIGTQTRAAWERYSCDAAALKCFKKDDK